MSVQLGSIHCEWKRCGKRSCACTRGRLHGPYWYRHFREAGKQHKVYVRASEVESVQAECSERLTTLRHLKAQRAKTQTPVQQGWHEFRRLIREIRAAEEAIRDPR
jgi:hypothetical protein